MSRWIVLAGLLVVACDAPSDAPAPAAPAPTPVATAPTPVATAPAAAKDWAPPPKDAIPAGPLGESIARGKDLFIHTSERIPEYAPGNIRCSNCHLDEGRQLGAAALSGVHARFPKYMGRTGAVIPLQDRVNYCFTRSMGGYRLPTDSREMIDMMNYLAWLSEGVPVGEKVKGVDIPVLEPLEGDVARGEALYKEKNCVTCHMENGEGVSPAFPALWGPKSYSVGASMARHERAASFIQQFMPQTAPGTLTTQEAFDLAAYINSKPRLDSPGKENDWPEGGAPADVPYATHGHEAYRPPPLIERPQPERTIVPAPAAVAQATP